MDGGNRSPLLLFWVVAVAATSVACPAAKGQPSAVSPAKFAERFQGLPFGQDIEKLVAHVEKTLRADYAERIERTLDPHERDRLANEVALKVQAIRDSHIEFKAQKTGYNVSVVSGEFAHNTTESMLVVQRGAAHDYYFFLGPELWKVVTTETRTPSFPVFLVNVTQLYGAPKVIEYEQPETRDQPVRAVWEDDQFELEVRSRPDYGAITVRWATKSVLSRIAGLRGGAKPPENKGTDTIDPTILDVMKD